MLLAIAQPFIWFGVSSAAANLLGDRSQNEQVVDVRQRVLQIEESIEEHEALWNQLSIVRPREKDTVAVIERLERLAGDFGVSVEVTGIAESVVELDLGRDEQGEITVGPLSLAEGITPLTISAEASGSPDALLRYLEALERMPEITTVKRVTLEPLQTTFTEPEATVSQSASHAMSVELTFYLEGEDDG